MRGRKISEKEINRIIELRKKGRSLPEIRKITGKSNSIVSKYIQGVKILPEYYNIWKSKQGASRFRAKAEWEKAELKAKKLIDSFNRKERLLIAACLYWGEGTKMELNLSNTDHDLIRVFVRCLRDFDVSKERLRVNIRIYEDIDKDKAIRFWAKTIGINEQQILGVNILKGKKKGKLEYGMCRIRVTKGARYFKLIKSIIALIKQNI